MWQRFTERARRVVFFAQEEAGRLGENHVSTEHLLLGLVRENDSVAARILDMIGVSPQTIRSEIEKQVTRGSARLGQDMQLTPRAKRAIDLAYDEARQFNNNYIGTEHLLLGIIREGEGLAGRVLAELGVELERTRREVRTLQDNQPQPAWSRLLPMAVADELASIIEEAGDQPVTLPRDLAQKLKEHFAGSPAQQPATEPTRLKCKWCGRWSDTADVCSWCQKPLLPSAPPSAAAQAGYGVSARMMEFMRRRFGRGRVDSQAVDSDVLWAREQIQSNSLELRGASLLSMSDLTPAQLDGILRVTRAMEVAHRTGQYVLCWDYPNSLALVFEKPSLRTRVTFELGMQQMGGLTVVLGPQEIGLGTRESIPDAARNLERWVDAVMARVFDHKTLIGLRDNCKIPIINGLSDREHPCQILADLYTIQQKKGQLAGIKVAWVGDGYNVLHSLLLGGALAGMTIHAACPPGYEPDPAIVDQARALAEAGKKGSAGEGEQQSGGAEERGSAGFKNQNSKLENPAGRILLTTDPIEAVTDADVVITDVWTSMGQEEEKARRLEAFAGFQVNAVLMAHARPDAIFMHCLPAHRGEEVTDEVIDSPQSVVFDEAENRMYAQKAVLALVLGA